MYRWLILILTAAIVAGVTLAPAWAAPAAPLSFPPQAKAGLTLSPVHGSSGTVAQVAGAGFGRRESVSILWDAAVLTTTVSTKSGRMAATVVIPLAAAGPHVVTAQGNTSKQTATATFTILIASNPPAWVTMAPMPTARGYLAVAAGLDGRIYAIGGSTAPNRVLVGLNTVEAYTPWTDTWTTVAPMPTPRLWLETATDLAGHIYAMGGYLDFHGASITNTVEMYTPATDTWTTVAPLPVSGGAFAAVTGADGRIYAIGVSHKKTVYAYTPQTNKWNQLAFLKSPVCCMAAATGGDGRIYVLGGDSSSCSACTTAQTYNPRANAWTYVASLPDGREWQGAATGSDGRIYDIGGFGCRAGNCQVQNNVVAYTLGQNTWTSVDGLPDTRENGAAVTGLDGRIYYVGGISTSCYVCSTLYVYGPRIAADSLSAPAGATVMVTGTNFAANAAVDLGFTTATAEVHVSGATDGSGNLLNSLSFTIPAGTPAGVYPLRAMDNHSQYPVTLQFTVTGAAPPRRKAEG